MAVRPAAGARDRACRDLGRAADRLGRCRTLPSDQLAGELAARRVPLAEAEGQIDAFADTLAPERKAEQLTHLFARTLEIINRDRTSIIQGIKKYARGSAPWPRPSPRRTSG